STNTLRRAGMLNPYPQSGVDFGLIESVVWYICATYMNTNGGILVFLPGAGEITELMDRLTRSASGRGSKDGIEFKDPPASLDSIRIIPLHGELPTAMQRKVFESVPKRCRKIVLATNIAET